MVLNKFSNEVFGFFARDCNTVDRFEIQNFIDRIDKLKFLLFLVGSRSGKFLFGLLSRVLLRKFCNVLVHKPHVFVVKEDEEFRKVDIHVYPRRIVPAPNYTVNINH